MRYRRIASLLSAVPQATSFVALKGEPRAIASRRPRANRCNLPLDSRARARAINACERTSARLGRDLIAVGKQRVSRAFCTASAAVESAVLVTSRIQEASRKVDR